MTEGELVYNANSRRSPLVLQRRVTYHGFELEREIEAIDEFPPELAERARRVLAEALARGEARHAGAQRNQEAIDSIRETYRRSGGQTPKLGQAELAALYERQLASVNSVSELRHAPLDVNADEIVPRDVRERYAALPSSVSVRGRDVEIHYDVEETRGGSARRRAAAASRKNRAHADGRRTADARSSAALRRHARRARCGARRDAGRATG